MPWGCPPQKANTYVPPGSTTRHAPSALMAPAPPHPPLSPCCPHHHRHAHPTPVCWGEAAINGVLLVCVEPPPPPPFGLDNVGQQRGTLWGTAGLRGPQVQEHATPASLSASAPPMPPLPSVSCAHPLPRVAAVQRNPRGPVGQVHCGHEEALAGHRGGPEPGLSAGGGQGRQEPPVAGDQGQGLLPDGPLHASPSGGLCCSRVTLWTGG